VLCATALDKDTGEALSVDKANQLIAARGALSALETVQQAVHALFDLRLHGCAADAICRREMTTTQLYADISQFALPNVIRDQRSAWQHRYSFASYRVHHFLSQLRSFRFLFQCFHVTLVTVPFSISDLVI
jgi:Zn-dependent oligopeptidase